MRNYHLPLNWFQGILCFMALALASIPSMASSWVGLYGGTSPDYPEAMTATSDGGFIVAAYTENYGHGKPERPDILLLKLDGQGRIEWQRVIGKRGHSDKAKSVIETAGGKFVVAGITYSNSTGYAEAWVVVFSRRGEVLWQRAYGGQPTCYARSIAECPDGGFALCGTWWDPDYGETHPWVLRLDSEGDVLWEKAFWKSEDWGVIGEWLSVLPDMDGGCTVWGYYKNIRIDISASYGHLAKLDSLGRIQRQRLYPGISEANLVRTGDGGAVLAGWKNITRLDVLGNVVWNMVFDFDYYSYFKGIAINPEGGYFVFINNYGPLLIGLSEQGEILWSRRYDAARTQMALSSFCGSLDGGVALGVYSGGFNPGIGILKTGADGTLDDPCTSTSPPGQPHWPPLTPLTPLDTVDLDPLDFEPACETTRAVPGEPSVYEAHSFCPVIARVRELHDPYRLELTGSLFYDWNNSPYPSWWVTVDGVRVPQITPKTDRRMILKGGGDLKALLPKGEPVCIKIIGLNPVDPLYNSACYTFTR